MCAYIIFFSEVSISFVSSYLATFCQYYDSTKQPPVFVISINRYSHKNNIQIAIHYDLLFKMRCVFTHSLLMVNEFRAHK